MSAGAAEIAWESGVASGNGLNSGWTRDSGAWCNTRKHLHAGCRRISGEQFHADRPVVDEGHLHVGTESSGADFFFADDFAQVLDGGFV